MEIPKYETEVLTVSDNDSDSSYDAILPLSERIKKLSQTEDEEKRFTSIKPRCSSTHSISDSEDENEATFEPNKTSSDEEDPVLPDISCIFPNQKLSQTEYKKKRFTSLKAHWSSTHSISDSEEENIADEDNPVSPDLACSFPNYKKSTSVSSCSSSSKLQCSPLEVPMEVNDVFTQAPKRSRTSPQSKQILELEKRTKQEQRLKEQELKKKRKELDKALKAAEREVIKSSKPEEYAKSLKVVVDGNLVSQENSSEFFTELESSNLNYAIEPNHIKFSVVWYRLIVHVSVENDQVCKNKTEELEKLLVLFIPNDDFVKMVHASVQVNKGKQSSDETLLSHLSSIKTMFPLINITCVIVGLDSYLYASKSASSETNKKPSKRLTKNNIEEAMLEVQLQMFVTFKLINNMKEFAQLLHHYTKAIAVAPSKNERNEKDLAFSWFAEADSNKPVKLDKDGAGGIKLWKQQIQQFNNVGNETSEAIVAKYPSPKLLLEAYKNCSSEQEAQRLLKDIVVRRDYGPLGTRRKIGLELSHKIHLFFTSADGNQLLQRS